MSRMGHWARPASSARQGAGIVAAAIACLLLAPVMALTAPSSQPVAGQVTTSAAGPAH